MILKSKVFKNFVSLSFAELTGKLFGFIALAYLARVISPHSFGIIAFSTAFVSYFLLFVELGFDVISVKKIANDRSIISKYVNNVVSVKLINALLLFALLVAVTFLLEKSTLLKVCIIIYGFMLFVQAGTLDFLFQGIEKFKYISLNIIGKSAFYLLLVMLFVKDDLDTYKVLVFMVISAMVFKGWQFYVYMKHYGKFKFEIDKQFVKKLFNESYPLLISVLMATIYGNLDLVMLGFMKTNYEVGIYNASYKIFLIAILPFGIVLKIYLPMLSRLKNTSQFKKDLRAFTVFMILIGLIISIPLFLFSGKIIELVFGAQYLAADLSLKILLANGMIVCMSIVFGNPLTVWGKQKYHAMVLSLGAITNIVLNVLLIPAYSYNGAALATLLSELAVFIGVTIIFVKSIKPLYSKAVTI
ncbi:MAG: flippase [Ignavibacteriales bacterium]|jgi:O-antigen/teichoic acid export membrane protein|nr:MAG: flippase [Ignavibacteriales bacterium]